MAMQKNNYNPLIAQFQDFRQKLYNCFYRSSDACMDLLDALAANTIANSIAELSLSPLFSRSYNSIYKAIKEAFNTTCQDTGNKVEEEKEEKEEEKPNNLIRVVSELIEQPQQRDFYLFATDTTPHPRPYARTLVERGYIYQPNTIKGNKPINIGHSYSLLSILPEKETERNAAWAIPLSGERVSLDKSGVDVASEQIQSVMCDSSLPWHEKLCVLVADTAYSQRSFLFEQSKHKNLVVVARCRSNRIFYQSPSLEESNKKRGCPKKYGKRIEHMLRFGKQRLLMTEFQTPDIKHEENWIQFVLLAYVQLWAARDLATHLPRPWERYLEQSNDKIATPSVVQRDFQRIISEIGTPARSPKTRGNSIGRVQGQAQTQRTKHPVVKKQSKSAPNKQKAA